MPSPPVSEAEEGKKKFFLKNFSKLFYLTWKSVWQSLEVVALILTVENCVQSFGTLARLGDGHGGGGVHMPVPKLGD